MTMTEKTLADIAALAGVQSVRKHEASGRYYLNMAQGGGNADRNSKVWIKGDTLTVEWGKGNHSPAFKTAIDELEAFATANATVSRPYPSAPSFTAAF